MYETSAIDFDALPGKNKAECRKKAQKKKKVSDAQLSRRNVSETSKSKDGTGKRSDGAGKNVTSCQRNHRPRHNKFENMKF